MERFKGPHNFERIAQVLNNVRQQYGIDNDKIVATVTDNGEIRITYLFHAFFQFKIYVFILYVTFKLWDLLYQKGSRACM